MRLQASLLLAAIVLVGGCDEEDVAKPAPRPAEQPLRKPPVPSDDEATAAGDRLRFATTDDSDFVKLSTPKSGEWLAEHEERGQTFADYAREDPVRATAQRRVLAFLPVGEFTKEQEKTARAAVEFAGVWYDLDIRVLAPAELPKEEWQRVRHFRWSEEPVTQFQTRYFLDRLLPRNLPDDAVSLIGVTMADLYPEPSWNYVFGQADLRHRVGVYSLARYFPGFWGEEDTAEARLQALRRSLKLVTHEIGHTFGIEHCVFYECNMNGSNSLQESDSRPLRLCPVCMRKLQWNRGFDVVERYEGLLEFYRRHSLIPEAEWAARRVEKITRSPR